jgi:molybdenum cofactor cytidylyltransferase
VRLVDVNDVGTVTDVDTVQDLDRAAQWLTARG